MRAERRLDLVLLWHMHQPDYRDYETGEFRFPWTYLHVTKDYSDMAWHLEHHPGIRAVVNFTPVLLDQIEDYSEQFASGRFRDPLLRLLARAEKEPLSAAERALILERCFQAGHRGIIQPFPAYKALHELFAMTGFRGQDWSHYFSDQCFFDVLTWFHIGWTGETVRRSSETVTRLMAVGTRFSHTDRLALLELIGEQVRNIIPRYAKMAAAGAIELSTTPQHHPLAPLLMSFGTAREADPDVVLPQAPEYPGGTERLAAQIRVAIDEHARRFGEPPVGVWPAEGAISDGFLGLLASHGFKWTASGGQVLRNSLSATKTDARDTRPYRAYCDAATSPGLALFFREDRLSDLIGFEYARWHSRDATANFISRLEAIAAAADEDEVPLVSVILDGENCWEYYPYNGYYFLDELYRRLESHAGIRTTTYRVCVEREGEALAALDRVIAGSWVYGKFDTWIGSPDKNRAWDLLCAAKRSFDLVIGSGRLGAEQARAAYRQLAACEASDCFWWMGDYNPRAAVASFDALYRAGLANLYRQLDLPVPAALAQAISHGEGEPEANGAVRRAIESSPTR